MKPAGAPARPRWPRRAAQAACGSSGSQSKPRTRAARAKSAKTPAQPQPPSRWWMRKSTKLSRQCGARVPREARAPRCLEPLARAPSLHSASCERCEPRDSLLLPGPWSEAEDTNTSATWHTALRGTNGAAVRPAWMPPNARGLHSPAPSGSATGVPGESAAGSMALRTCSWSGTSSAQTSVIVGARCWHAGSQGVSSRAPRLSGTAWGFSTALRPPAPSGRAVWSRTSGCRSGEDRRGPR
mmetsp:Transcript_20167/g.63052  ORF Transcript_20167/g.63052 Transcript_20167/m.63052 type:complete len:241 (-) Transcript_20167:45-767(-)